VGATAMVSGAVADVEGGAQLDGGKGPRRQGDVVVVAELRHGLRT
jgi:hypothetical protein